MNIVDGNKPWVKVTLEFENIIGDMREEILVSTQYGVLCLTPFDAACLADLLNEKVEATQWYKQGRRVEQ